MDDTTTQCLQPEVVVFSYWINANQCPEFPGHYLVLQYKNPAKKYRWVRYFNGDEWSNIHEDQYGPVILWSFMPEIPKDI